MERQRCSSSAMLSKPRSFLRVPRALGAMQGDGGCRELCLFPKTSVERSRMLCPISAPPRMGISPLGRAHEAITHRLGTGDTSAPCLGGSFSSSVPSSSSSCPPDAVPVPWEPYLTYPCIPCSPCSVGVIWEGRDKHQHDGSLTI